MASAKRKSVLDALVAGSSSDSDSEEEEGKGRKEAEADGPSKKKGAISLLDLQRAGYKSGPSVLLMRDPGDAAQTSWNWWESPPACQAQATSMH